MSERAPNPEINEAQLRFAQEYAAEPNATQAYRRAYPSCTYQTARVEGRKLLAIPAISAEIQAARRAWEKRCSANFETVVRKLASIALGDPADLYEPDPENCGLPKPRPWADIPPTARKNIVTVKIKRRRLKGADDCLYELEELEYKVLDPMAALDKLCSYLGVTKGSLTADDLRNIITGQTAAANQGPAGPAAPPGTEPTADQSLTVESVK